MRTRLVLFGLSLISLFAVIMIIVWGLLSAKVLPVIEDHLEQKLARGVALVESDLDIGMAAEDMALIRQTMSVLSFDDDIAYTAVFDIEGSLIYESGPSSFRPDNLNTGETASKGALSKMQVVEFEGLALGHVFVVVSRQKLLTMQTWAHRMLAFGILVIVLSSAFVIRYSTQFVAPINEAIGFCRRVASGDLRGELTLHAPGELGDLFGDLNNMTRSLEERDLLLDAKRCELADSLDELRTAQQKLVATSRAAGKAEIATNVLHNVGNTLNSTITSCSVVREIIRNSPIVGLRKAGELLHAHEDNLAEFAGTARGKLLPTYIHKLSEELQAERDLVLAELERQERSIEHIARIVAAQQHQTRVDALVESFPLKELLEDALALGSIQYETSSVSIEGGENLELYQDRNKLLEILANLATNAVDAMRDSKIGGELKIASRLVGDQLEVTVADDGCGMPADVINKVFVHGFSTKANGHGFGLHFCVNAARQLGGDLRCESPGAGQGATFILTIPRVLKLANQESA
jgi:signal transduction histidine kinase